MIFLLHFCNISLKKPPFDGWLFRINTGFMVIFGKCPDPEYYPEVVRYTYKRKNRVKSSVRGLFCVVRYTYEITQFATFLRHSATFLLLFLMQKRDPTAGIPSTMRPQEKKIHGTFVISRKLLMRAFDAIILYRAVDHRRVQ